MGIPPLIQPLQISVSLPQECTSLSSLVLRATQSTPAIEPASMSVGDLQYLSEVTITACILQYSRAHSNFQTSETPKCNLTFLPLPPDFDSVQGEDWVALAKRIQDWLLKVVLDTHSQEWLWGREVFWITFIAAYPLFPLGSWLMWDSKISLEGSFIQSWMDRMSVDGVEADSKDVVSLAEGLSAEALGNIRADLWEEFRCTVSLFYPHKLISNI
jgi:hypothetical protein